MPFDLLRACFWLMAIIVILVMVMLVAIATGCGYMVISGRMPPGTCVALGISGQLRELFSEVLTAVLALLLAARSPPPPPDKDQ